MIKNTFPITHKNTHTQIQRHIKRTHTQAVTHKNTSHTLTHTQTHTHTHTLENIQIHYQTLLISKMQVNQNKIKSYCAVNS